MTRNNLCSISISLWIPMLIWIFSEWSEYRTKGKHSLWFFAKGAKQKKKDRARRLKTHSAFLPLINFGQRDLSSYGNTGCKVFKWRVQNCKIKSLKIKIPKRNYWILRIGVVGRCQKVPYFWLSKSIFYIKNHWNLFLFFSLKNTNLAAYFLLFTFFDNIIHFITKMMPIFWQLATTPILIIQ